VCVCVVMCVCLCFSAYMCVYVCVCVRVYDASVGDHERLIVLEIVMWAYVFVYGLVFRV